MRYLTYADGKLYISSVSYTRELSSADLNYVGGGDFIIFANLSAYGLELIHVLDSWSLDFEVNAIKLDIYWIRCNGAVFKNSRLFDLDLSGCYSDIYKRCQSIRLLISRLTGGTIYDRNICSTASISALAIRRLCPLALRSFDQQVNSILRGCFFGGRKQRLGNFDSEMWYFDFSNTYGNLLKLDYPLDCRLDPLNLDFNRPGFYDIIFEYNGPLNSVKLPTRRGGSTVYEVCGRGWYWHEEIDEFKLCGGKVYYCGGSLVATQNFAYLKPAADFLINQRSLGVQNAKAVLNGVYGRLAIKPTNKVTRIDKCGGVDDIYDYQRYVKHKNFIMYETDSKRAGKNIHGNICWACIISSRGRTQLMRLMFECEMSGLKPAYVNTDCVYVSSENEPVIDSSRLMQPVRFVKKITIHGEL